MKLLIANRGEIAVRIARTCRALGIPSVAVFSDADASALHVSACDEAVRIGGLRAADSYLKIDALLEAARKTGATAVHPGYGFLSENAGFARAVEGAGLTWVGPSPDAIAAMGDKLEGKRRMAAAGVPVLPGVELADGVEPDAGEVGFPLLVKAAAGGGGRGMRLVKDAAGLPAAVASARREAQGAFGDGRVFLERYVSRPHHIEVQILGDSHGNLVHLFERECSIQRRHQKIVEESPSPRLPPELRRQLCEAAVRAGEAIAYRSAGTVEFVAEEEDGVIRRFFFLEVNTRLQVEHPVTEGVVRAAGLPLDLVALQIAVAQGERLPFVQEDLALSGHAIEVRLYAEDPAQGFRPSPGRVLAFEPPAEPAVRWDVGVASGHEVTPYYDPMIAKVIAQGERRADAASALARALEQTLLSGIVTNRALLVKVLRDEAFLEGRTTTHFLDERFPDAASRGPAPSEQDRRDAAVAAALAELHASPHPGAPAVPPRFGAGTLPSPFRIGGMDIAVSTRRDGSHEVEVGGEKLAARVVSRDPLVLELGGRRFAARVFRSGSGVSVMLPSGQVDLAVEPRFPEVAAVEQEGSCVAPMPGSVAEIAVQPGEDVRKGQLLIVLEAMKMEHRLTAPFDGKVAEVRVRSREQVAHDQVLVVLSPR